MEKEQFCKYCGAKLNDGAVICTSCGRATTEKKKKPIYKKWWFWVIIAVVVIAAIGGASGSGKEEAPKSTTQQSGEPTSQETPKATDYRINETASVGDLEYTVLSVEDTDHIGGEYLGKETANNYVIITFKVKNTGSDEKSILTRMALLKNGNSEYEVSSDGIYLQNVQNSFVGFETIGAGITKTLTAVFETPSEHTSDYYLECKDSSYGLKSVKIYLK